MRHANKFYSAAFREFPKFVCITLLSYENGEEFMEFFYRAAAGKIEPFILVIEGSIPNENNKAEGY